MNYKIIFLAIIFSLYHFGLVFGMYVPVEAANLRNKEIIERQINAMQGIKISWSPENKYPHTISQEGTLTITQGSFYITYTGKTPTIIPANEWTNFAIEADELTKIRQQRIPFYIYNTCRNQDKEMVKITRVIDAAPQVSSSIILHGKEEPNYRKKEPTKYIEMIIGGISSGITVIVLITMLFKLGTESPRY